MTQGMAETVNLRAARKAKARQEKQAGAATNRAKFGESAAARQLRESRERLDKRRLDGLKLIDSAPSKPDDPI